MSDERWTGKYADGSACALVWYHPKIFLEGLRQAKKNLRFPWRESNRGTPNYKPWALPLHQSLQCVTYCRDQLYESRALNWDISTAFFFKVQEFTVNMGHLFPSIRWYCLRDNGGSSRPRMSFSINRRKSQNPCQLQVCESPHNVEAIADISLTTDIATNISLDTTTLKLKTRQYQVCWESPLRLLRVLTPSKATWLHHY